MSNIKLDDYYEDAYPEHNRTTCSDENPCNAEVSGHGCLRFNAIFFTKAKAMQSRINELEALLVFTKDALASDQAVIDTVWFDEFTTLEDQIELMLEQSK